MPTVCFDGLVGPTHNYSGLSAGNLAATAHRGEVSDPRAAALEGLHKMRVISTLGVPQAILPPQERPLISELRRLGFSGTDAEVLGAADPTLVALVSSASSMWAANAATIAPSTDTADGKVHVTPANLSSMGHRALEAPFTTRLLRAIFADPERFVVHEPLPRGDLFSDEGAANHIRLESSRGPLHMFAWGRSSLHRSVTPSRHPARQSREASQALARLHRLHPERVIFPQQDPAGIDAGAFHTDVLAVGNGSFLMFHEHAFRDTPLVIDALRDKLGSELVLALARDEELSLTEAVESYLFNSELLTLPSGRMALVAPKEAKRSDRARAFLDKVVAEANPVDELHFVDVNSSMRNGGGPACLRLAVPLTDQEITSLGARVMLDDALYGELATWINRHYRDHLAPADLADPALLVEARSALDELTRILRLGPFYEFQRA